MIAGNTRHVCRRCEAWVVSQFEILSRVVAHQDERSADHQQNDYRQRIGGLNIVAASHKSDHLALPCSPTYTMAKARTIRTASPRARKPTTTSAPTSERIRRRSALASAAGRRVRKRYRRKSAPTTRRRQRRRVERRKANLPPREWAPPLLVAPLRRRTQSRSPVQSQAPPRQ